LIQLVYSIIIVLFKIIVLSLNLKDPKKYHKFGDWIVPPTSTANAAIKCQLLASIIQLEHLYCIIRINVLKGDTPITDNNSLHIE